MFVYGMLVTAFLVYSMAKSLNDPHNQIPFNAKIGTALLYALLLGFTTSASILLRG